MTAQREDVGGADASVVDDDGGRAGQPPAGRRSRPRGVVALGAVVVVVALVVGLTAVLRTTPTDPQPADVPEHLHLPTVVHAPGTWSDAEGPVGPLAAVGLALRTRPEGVSDEREQLALFGVSAVDGRSEWIRLPGVDDEEQALVG